MSRGGANAPRAGTLLALPGWPVHDEAEIAAVAAVLRSGRTNYWTGDRCRAFERAFAEHVGSPHGLSVANGTVAMELALAALGIGPGDEVLVPGRSFVASASAVVARGAVPVFVDIGMPTQGMCPAAAAAAVTPRTRALVAVHLAGWPCDIVALGTVARRHGLFLVEDCAQAHGAAVGGRLVGSFGAAAAFSFCQDKIMSTGGEGGMIVCADRETYERAWSMREHGKRFGTPPGAGTGGYRHVHDSHGTNARMTESQAAIGLVQLRRLEQWVARRQSNIRRLAAHFDELPHLEAPLPEPDVRHAGYRLSLYVDDSRLHASRGRDWLLREVQRAGIPATVGVCPELYRERALAAYAPPARLPVCRRVGESVLSLPVHPTLTDQHLDEIAATVLAMCQNMLCKAG